MISIAVSRALLVIPSWFKHGKFPEAFPLLLTGMHSREAERMASLQEKDRL